MSEEPRTSDDNESIPDNEPDPSVEAPSYENIDKGFESWDIDESSSDDDE